jgi:antitoxin component YwqK of YwqJK toxin-antitoxin module
LVNAFRTAALSAVAFGVNPVTAAEPPANLRIPERIDVAAADPLTSYGYLDDSNPAHENTVEVVTERYPNGTVKIERCVTLDADKNYVNHGAWKMLTPTGELIAEGQFEMGKRIGMWTRYHGRTDSPALNEYPYNRFRAPFRSHANFVAGQIDGEWLIEDADEKKCVQISFKTGERHGPAIAWLPNGKMYRQANYDEGMPVGDVLEVNAKSGEFERSASYVNGRKIITKTAYYKGSKQKKSEALYLAATTVKKTPDDFWTMRFAQYTSEGKDLRHGPSREWYASGKPQSDGNYQNDKRHGKFTFWHENGQVAVTGEYKDDQPDGLWVWFHENGLKSTVGKYENGTFIGEWRSWGEDGRLTRQKVYDGTESITAQPQEEDEDVFDLSKVPADEATIVR